MTNEKLEIEMNIHGLLELSKKQQRNIRIMDSILNFFIIEHLNRSIILSVFNKYNSFIGASNATQKRPTL